jgi:hypothetical protein
VIARRVGKALELLEKASQATDSARTTLLGKVARQLAALERRVSRAEERATIPADCASTLADLIASGQALARALIG